VLRCDEREGMACELMWLINYSSWHLDLSRIECVGGRTRLRSLRYQLVELMWPW